MSDLDHIKNAVSAFNKNGRKNFALLQCVSNYPAKIEDQNLNCMVELRKLFYCPTVF